ncbi:MAG: amidohydrolase family protein [Myxococcota bacterium]|nr:amidohydrolase family protein [Myxococcota bacterium]
MSEGILERVRAIDVDTHITEPADVWTSRVSSKWGDRVPHVKRVDGRDIWLIGDQFVGGPGWVTAAGFDGSFPESRSGYDDIPRSAYDAKARLEYMDSEGIWAQVLYPNVGGFGSGGFLKLGEPALMLECVQAYNDFLVEWCSEDPRRLVPVAAMPFWDVEASVKEVERAFEIGHKSILACSEPQAFGQPRLADKHWEPFWRAVEETGLPISFHIGSGGFDDLMNDTANIGVKANFGRASSTIFMQNMNCIADLVFGGICHRHPDLKLVSVESGVGWVPSFLEACDWQWTNGQVAKEHPEWDLLPSEYFKRQIWACFWFENKSLHPAIEQLGDNLLWETDFPHPTCQHPGPSNGLSRRPSEYADDVLGDLPEATQRKILHDNAAALYGLD